MIGRHSSDDAQSFDEAWNGRTPRDEQIVELVRFAEGLCEAAVVEPSPEFRLSLRAQLMAEAATVLTAQPATPRVLAPPTRESRPVRRRVVGLTTALVASAGVVGIVASSASAVPGDMLYSVKRSVESVELTLHRDDASRGAFQLAQASERLAEARKLSNQGASGALIADSLDDFANQASDGSGKLFADFSDSGQESSIRKVNDFAAAASIDLADLSGVLPDGADDAYRAATEAISQLATEATSLCSSCTTADVQSLVSAVDDLAKNTPIDKSPSAEDSDESASDDTAGSAGSGSASSPSPTPKPAKDPLVVLPTTPTTQAPSLNDITDPLLGGLLGSDEQEGLVPGLLNGLLGGSR